MSPRLNVSASPGISGLRLFVGVGRGVRPPAAATGHSEAVDLLAGRWGDIHTIENAELGVTWRGERLTLAAAAFGAVSTGEVLFDHVARTTTVVSASRRMGVEARAAWSLSRFINVSADVTAVDARLLPVADKGPGDWIFGGDAVPGVPNLSGTVRGALTPIDGVRLGVSSQALSPRPLRFGAVAPPAVVVNGFARWAIGNVTLEVAIDNLLNADYVEGAGMFASHWDAGQPRSQLPTQHWYAGMPRLLRAGLSVDL